MCILFCSVPCRNLSFGFYFLKYLGILQFTLEPEHLSLNMKTWHCSCMNNPTYLLFINFSVFRTITACPGNFPSVRVKEMWVVKGVLYQISTPRRLDDWCKSWVKCKRTGWRLGKCCLFSDSAHLWGEAGALQCRSLQERWWRVPCAHVCMLAVEHCIKSGMWHIIC